VPPTGAPGGVTDAGSAPAAVPTDVLGGSGAGTGTQGAAGTTDTTAGTSSQAGDEPPPTVYITGGDGSVIAGHKPSGILLEQSGVTSADLIRPEDGKVIATIHVPVAVDTNFMKHRLGAYVSAKGGSVFVTDGHEMVTAVGTFRAPSHLPDGLSTENLLGKNSLVFTQGVLDGRVHIGSSVPTAEIAAAKQRSLSSLIGFIIVLLLLTLIQSFAITRAVGDALKRFAAAAGELAAGRLERRIPVVGADEVAALSNSFNEMAGNLQDRIESLVEARAKMKRQVELFGEALANATEIGEMLQAVCGLALESTPATHARFWTVDENGHFAHSACIGLRPDDREPCGLERAVTIQNRSICNDGTPSWLVVPARIGDSITGLLTLVCTDGTFSEDDVRMAERLGTQAAVAIDNARMHEKLRLQATRDGLTGLPNHRSLQDALSKALDEAYRRHMPLGVALMDIDNFKRINDTYGHPIGDEAIKALGRVLSHGIGEMGMAARYGGEEFVVLMPGCDAQAACRIADRLREDITYIEVPLEDGGILKFTASFGVANVDQNHEMVDNAELLRQADVGLYNAKRTGKNRVTLGGPDVKVIEMTEAEKARLAAREKGTDTLDLAA
jgi:diguanylate cyclase (GGDEF)-like protein